MENKISGESETVTWEELSWSNHVELEALLRILVNKGLLTKDELIAEVKNVRNEYLSKKV